MITDDEILQKVIQNIEILLKKLIEDIASESWNNYGVVIISKTIKSSISLANQIAPEHLELAIDNSKKYLKEIKNAGAIFLGKYLLKQLVITLLVLTMSYQQIELQNFLLD